jgi:hypothetical protein
MAAKLELWLLSRAETTVIALKRGRWIERRRAAKLLRWIDARLIGGLRPPRLFDDERQRSLPGCDRCGQRSNTTEKTMGMPIVDKTEA